MILRFATHMIQLRTTLAPADNTGIKKIRVILVHGGSRRRFGHIGDLITASVIDANPETQFKKGSKVKGVIVRTRAPLRRPDGTWIRFDDNSVIILESLTSKNPAGTRVFGPVAHEIKDLGFTKIASLAKEVL